jgi:hypothetical protein
MSRPQLSASRVKLTHDPGRPPWTPLGRPDAGARRQPTTPAPPLLLLLLLRHPPPAAAELLAVATFAAAIGYEAEVAWLTHLSRLFWADHGLVASLGRTTAAAEVALRERCPAVSVGLDFASDRLYLTPSALKAEAEAAAVAEATAAAAAGGKGKPAAKPAAKPAPAKGAAPPDPRSLWATDPAALPLPDGAAEDGAGRYIVARPAPEAAAAATVDWPFLDAVLATGVAANLTGVSVHQELLFQQVQMTTSASPGTTVWVYRCSPRGAAYCHAVLTVGLMRYGHSPPASASHPAAPTPHRW